jgi:hypothetical protein
MRLFLIGWALLLVLGAVGLVARSSDQTSSANAAPASQRIQASTANSVPQKESLTQEITDPTHLALLREAIDSGGYNCSRIISASYSHEDSRGLNFSVGCSTGIFRVTANRAGRVTAVTCRHLCS